MVIGKFHLSYIICQFRCQPQHSEF